MISYLKKDLKSLFNIGDSLCTPDVYFNISSEKDLRIIGGGVWNIKKYGTDPTASKTILWSAGESHKHVNPGLTDSIKFDYLEWSSRDKDLLNDKSRFVPCVSCFHNELLKEPLGSKTMIFTNANNVVSAKIKVKETDDLCVLTNNTAYDVFIKKWQQCDKIITNSYHGIYWSLLSGREVAPFGYSSKFRSVLKLFDFELPEDQMYNIKDRFVLNNLISSKDKKFFSTKNSNNYLNDFKELNFQFSEKLEKHGVICKIK